MGQQEQDSGNRMRAARQETGGPASLASLTNRLTSLEAKCLYFKDLLKFVLQFCS